MEGFSFGHTVNRLGFITLAYRLEQPIRDPTVSCPACALLALRVPRPTDNEADMIARGYRLARRLTNGRVSNDIPHRGSGFEGGVAPSQLHL